MKKLIAFLFVFPSLSYGAAFELYINQRNIANSATATRTVPIPALNVNSVLGVSQFDNLPVLWKLGTSVGVFNGELISNPEWTSVLNKPAFSAVSTSGDYNDLINRPATTSRVQSSELRPLDTAFMVSYIRDAMVSYSVQCVITANIPDGQSCDVVLEIASDDAFTSDVQTVGIIGTGQAYTLATDIQSVQPQTAQLTGYVPAGYYARLRTISVTGSPTFSVRAGQEVLQ